MEYLEIQKQAKELCLMSDEEAYEKGLELLIELRKHKDYISRAKYKKIEYLIQEQRFR